MLLNEMEVSYLKKKYPRRGSYTIENDEEIITDICEVCLWQFDMVAQRHPEKSIGPDKVSLSKAGDNYKKYSTCKRGYADKKVVRKPLNGELLMLFE